MPDNSMALAEIIAIIGPGGPMAAEAYTLPNLPDPYGGALEDAVSYIIGRFDPIGILATGTILRGNPGPNSDLDIFALWHRPERQRVQRFFRGVPAEIFVNPPERVRRYFSNDQASGRPVTAHMFATGIVVLDREGIVAELNEAARQCIAEGPRVSADDRVAERYGIATCFEDAADVATVDLDACLMLLNQAVERALAYRFVGGGIWIPRSKDLLDRLVDVDVELAAKARRFFAATTSVERLGLARDIVRRSVSEIGAFEWESRLEIS